MPKQLNVNLAFTADTSQAKKQLQDLQNQLTKLTTDSLGNTGKFGITKEIQDATAAAAQLKVQLEGATNVNTGKLDLGKFAESMSRSGMDLEQYRKQLSALGPEGSKAFLSLAQSISNAEVPLRRSSALLDQFWTALKNTARWQISSSAIHGLWGAIQGAYGYAQDLNQSLNSIRIVSGQSVDNMKDFAEQANKSAQALSTSTLAYTDAALIFYQQGLSGDAVTERVDTVLKLSNITGDSAEQVSNYMTAIWNNFYDGSQSLESFADKITALGAATASSSAEISAGLQQFASIANTVGLSYDYAVTALATIVAKTRQSESTVGNGLRTIFARLSSLKEGGLTDDGVDLTKYTKALQDIGVQLFDQNGQYREMDGILNDIGEKWQTLSKNQQIALAQTVGGVRQYATLMALFDDWDQFQRNLDVTQNAEGALQKQADTYAESWEAAQKRVKAAAQGIYQELINDNFFIWLKNVEAEILNGINKIIKSAGGLKGVLGALGAVITGLLSKQLEQTLNNLAYSMNMLTASGRQKITDLREQSWEEAKQLNMDTGTNVGAANATVLDNTINLQKSMYENAQHMTEEELKQNQLLLDANQILQQRHIENGKNLDDLLKESEELEAQVIKQSVKNLPQGTFNNKKFLEDRQVLEDAAIAYANLSGAYKEIKTAAESATPDIEKLNTAITTLEKNGDVNFAQSLRNNINQIGKDTQTNDAILSKIRDKQITAMANYGNAIDNFTKSTKAEGETVDSLAGSYVRAAQAAKTFNESGEQLKQNQEYLIDKFEKATVAVQQFSASLVTTMQGLSQLVFAISSLSKAIDTINNKDLTFFEKVQSVVPSLAFGLPSLINGLKILNQGTGIFSALKDGIGMFAFGLKEGEGALASFKLGATAAGEALTPLMTTLIHIVPYIFLAVAAFVALKQIWDVLYSKTPEGKLEAANKKLEESKKKADEAAEAYQNLKSALEEYADVQKEISEMPVGLDKTDAILEENQKILDLLTENDLWDKIGTIEYDNSGLIHLTELQQEAIEKDLAREKILARQAELQDKINQLKAQEVKDQQTSYQGEKIEIQRVDKDSATTDKNGNTYYTRSSLADVSTDISRILTKNNLTITSDRDDIKKALENSGDEDIKRSLDSIMNNIDSIRSSEEKIAEFNQLQQDNVNDDKAIHAYELQYAQGAIGESLSEEVSYAPAQQALLEKFTELSPQFQQVIQEGLMNGTMTLTEGFKLAGIEVAQVIRDAMFEAETTAADKAATAFQSEGDLYFNQDDEIAQKQIEFVMSLSDEELADIGGWKGLQESIDNIAKEHNIELNVKASDFTQLKSSVKDEDIMQEVQDFADYIQKHAAEIDGLSKHLENCRAESEKLAYAIMRFDDAIQDVTENYSNWSEALAAGGMRAASVMRDLEKAYGNVLDIDGSLLSADFTEDIDNLNNMRAAIEGNEEAYNNLQYAAANDYLSNTLDVDTQYANGLISAIQEVQNALNQLDVGDVLDPTQFANIYAAFEELIANTQMTVEEFNALAAMLGFSADVKTEEQEVEDEHQAVDLDAEAYETGNSVQVPMIESSSETGTPQTFPIPLQGVKVKGTPHPIEADKKKTKTVVVGIETGDGKGLHKLSGGKIKHSQATHGGGGVPASKSSGGKGGGGGGGSSTPKKKTTKDPVKKKFEEDRYHNIKSAIDEVAKALERVDKLKERAYGKAKLKYMDQEIAKLKDQTRLQNEYIKQAETYLKMDRSKLEGLGMGAQFTDDGRLINYEQVLSNLVDTYNDAVDARNAAAIAFNNSEQEDADNEAFEAAEKQLKKAEETYNEQKKILDQYEKTYNTLQEQIDKRTELLNQIYDAKLAKVVYKVDIQIEVNDADIKYLEWLNKFLEKNLDNAEDIMANLSKAAQRTFKDIKAINQGLTELFANHDIQLDFNNMDPESLVTQLRNFMDKEGLGTEITEAEAKQIRDWNDKLMDYMSKWVEYWDKTHEMIDKVFEDYTKNVDREIDKMDAYTKLLDHYLKMLDLTGADRLGFSTKDILNVYDIRIKNEQNILSSLVTERKALEDTLLDYQKNLSQAETEEAKQYWEEHVKNAEDALQDVKDKVISATESTLEAVNERLEKAMELAEKQFKKRFDNLDLLMERFSRQQELDHLYLDDYEKYYELNKSAKELQKAIDGTNNAMMRGKFKELQDKVNASMSSGVKLSQTQTDIIAKRVELLKAEDELLNARNAKNTVRMTRDNEGNYSYTYTADQDMIDDAELNYNEKFYQLMNAERSGQEELQSQRLDYLNNYTSISQDLMNKLQTGDISQDQYDEAMAELQDQFQEYMDYYLEQLQFLYDEQATLRDDDLANAEELTELKLANYDDFITQYEDTILGRLFDDVSSEEEFTRLALEAMAQYHQENAEALNIWEGEVATTYEAAGLDVDNFRDTVNADLADIDQKSEETKQKITEMTDKMRADMQAVMEKALAMDQDWAQRMRSMRDQISQTVDSLNRMLEKLADVSGGFGYSGEAAVFAGAKYLEAGKDADVATKAFEAMEKAARAAEQAAKDALKAVNDLKNAGGSDDVHVTTVYGGPHAGNTAKWTSDGNYWFDTGGYTGSWGSEGRMAMLHEKELVLNKSDTSNMLNIVGMVRDLTTKIDLTHGLNAFTQSIMNSSNLALAGTDQLQQEVHIEANFPNVETHNEIELAFNNLINSATQYVNRK